MVPLFWLNVCNLKSSSGKYYFALIKVYDHNEVIRGLVFPCKLCGATIPVFLFMFSGSYTPEGPQVKSLKGLKPSRILFVGNSYLYYNDSLHNHVKRMAAEKFAERVI